MDLRMGKYSTKNKSNKWTRVLFTYILDTARVNAQTVWSLNQTPKKDPRKTDSFDFGIKLARALVLPQIERRSLNGLPIPIQLKMSMMLKRPVGRAAAAVQVGAAAPADGAAPAGAAAQVDGAVALAGAVAPAGDQGARPNRAMAKHPQNSEKPQRCKMCYDALPSTGHKNAKDNLSRLKTCCGSCGATACKNHMVTICKDCSHLFVRRNQGDN